MATASALIADVRTKVGDASGNFLTDSLALTWFDEAQSKIVEILKPLRRTKGFTISTNQDFFTIPSDVMMIQVALHARDIRRTLTRVNIGEFELARSRVMNATGYPTIWCEKDGRIYVWPRYNSASKTVVASGTATAAATTISVASSTNFRSYGRAKSGSVEFSYTSNDTGSGLLSGVVMGEGGTTAASISSGDTITQVDFELTYARRPVALASTAEPEINASFHSDLEYYVAYLFYRSEGNSVNADKMYALWQNTVKEAEYIAKRQHISRGLSVKDSDSQRTTGFWGTTT